MNFDHLTARENAVRISGTGLISSDLSGSWKLQRVWGKGQQKPNALNSWLLRSLRARLDIKIASSGSKQNLRLQNAINLGPLELQFQGPGSLEGRRPLLIFHFDSLTLRIAGVELIQKKLDTPPPKRFPFFALIERGSDGWLAARGRGGGLALWKLDEHG